MTDIFYKAVRLDKTSHYDKTTQWRMRKVVRVDTPDPPEKGECGRGIHCSRSLITTVLYQQSSSIYCIVKPLDIIAKGRGKVRCGAVRPIRWLTPTETDGLSGFKLWEANHPVNPLLLKPKPIDYKTLLREWIARKASTTSSVWDSERGVIWDSIIASTGTVIMNTIGVDMARVIRTSVTDSIWSPIWVPIRASVEDLGWDSFLTSIWVSVGVSIGIYIGRLFPNVEQLKDSPWRPLLKLWYAGYLPSFDGETWRLHCGKDAKVIWTC